MTFRKPLLSVTAFAAGTFIVFGSFLMLFFLLYFSDEDVQTGSTSSLAAFRNEMWWEKPDTNSIPHSEHGELIRYGRALVVHTSSYLGPHGTVATISNGMNCQNCHLEAGTKSFGNNYELVATTYPKFRERSGTIESVEKRINDCIERSLNGTPLDVSGKEMKAIKAYILWVGNGVSKEHPPKGAGLRDVAILERAADPQKGAEAYVRHCQRCHGADGKGQREDSGKAWRYPPLAGDNSYNTGAGLYRLSKFAAYVKSNMPDGVTFKETVLTDEEAWDVAAYINSLPRPTGHFPNDWPDISKKPFDHPFGPYDDDFSEAQHKFGPFAPIIAWKTKVAARSVVVR